jgi:hypothetical protein
MATTLLQLRMEALAQHLMEAQDPNTWLGSLQLSQKPDQNLWLKAVEAIGKEAENLLADLQKAMDATTGDDSSAEKTWNTYFHIYERSHEIFREFLELLGGLALRDRIHEEYACRFADELISECAELVGKTTSFAIPATEDALSSTLRRVARISFPDWHLWALPLVAYEYGQVVVRETSLSRFVDELAQEASKPTFDDLYNALRSRLQSIGNSDMRTIAMDHITRAEEEPGKAADEMQSLARVLHATEAGVGDLAQATAGSIRDCLGEATSRARVLVADAFATFTAGPAYGCAALMLRLSPNMPRLPGRPTDEERAATILAVLAEMDTYPLKPFTKVREGLEASWSLLVKGTESNNPSPRVESPLDAADALTRIKNRMLKRDQAGYTNSGWIKARHWSEEWWPKVSTGGTPEVPMDVPGLPDLRLRDVLNAAWQCRLQVIEELSPQDVNSATDKITAAARQLCDRILANRKGLGTPSDFGGAAPRP